MDFAQADISYGIELRDIYDGMSVWVLHDGTRINRWASENDPCVAYPGFERRFNLTRDYLTPRM